MHSAVKNLREFQSCLASKLDKEELHTEANMHRINEFLPFTRGNSSWDLSMDLIEEEYDEFMEACEEVEESDIFTEEEKLTKSANLLKEMCDLMYVLLGMSVRYKELYFLPEAFGRVHTNNMNKLRESTLGESGKLIKPSNYEAVDLTDLVIRGRNV
jgi:hypothetical protein